MKELILISITGMDRPGITASVTRILAEYDVHVLDIGQSVIREALSLGMLAGIPNSTDAHIVKDAVQAKIDALGLLTVRFVAISRASYEQWVGQQGKERHIVTLLSRRISAYHISRLTRIVARHGLNIDKINRLSGRISLEDFHDDGQACVEFSLRGSVADLPPLRREFMQLADELDDVDIAYQEDDISVGQTYGRYVQDREKQAWFHRARGWKTVQDVAEKEGPTVTKFVQQEIDRALAKP